MERTSSSSASVGKLLISSLVTVLAHRIETVLSEDGKLLLERLPFQAGQAVEVIVLLVTPAAPPNISLLDTVLRYDTPAGPVAEAD